MLHRALMVLLTIAILMGIPITGRAQDATPLPATAVMATPASVSAEITTEEVAGIALPAFAIPPPPAMVDVWLWSLTPGQEVAFAAGELPPSVAADVVLSGEVTVQSDGQLQVQRREGLEEVLPETDVTIGAGEAVIYVDNQAAQTVRNTGATEARAISVGVFSTAPPSPLSIGPVSPEAWERSGLAGHDLLIRVERLTLAPRARLPAFTPDVHAPRIFAVAEGVAQSVVVAADAATPARPVSFRRDWVLWFRMLGPGEHLQVRNAGDQPLVLLQVTLSADPSEPAARATPTA
jgi:mannose-6-phosphate isomerase-like protein (cupin superfamily)